jgi:hypothetical protein
MSERRTRKGVARKTTDYTVKTYTIWMLDNKGKMTSTDHREIFRTIYTYTQEGKKPAEQGVNHE